MPRVEVVYAYAARQSAVTLDLPIGSSVEDAVRESGLAAEFADVNCCRLGIHGQVVAPGQLLREGNRVEIYRPLTAEPKTARRERALRAMRRRR